MHKLAPASIDQEALQNLSRLETELEAVRHELDHAHRLATLGTLTAGIAHEINNILTPVLAYAQLARANPDDRAMANKALERSVAGVQSAARITEAVLGFARHPDETDHADVAEVIESSLSCIGHDPARDGIEVGVRATRETRVAMPPLALQQVVMNLIINATNAITETGGGGRIDITAGPGEAGRTVITVADSGPGIPEEIRKRLFEPFVSGRNDHGKDGHAKAPHRPRLGGSGLGLAICRRLIEGAHGSISVDSTRGDGATFTIVLPNA